MHIGENIKRLRQAKNITQEKLAEYLNISAPAVSKWERRETLPDITMVIPLCQRILDECTITSVRYGATHVLAKIYKARGEYEKAIACFNDFPSWYDTKGHRLEQLHEKNSDQFRFWVNKNLTELLDFAFNKAGKVIWYTQDSVEKRIAATTALVSAIEGYIKATGYVQAYSYIAAVYHEGGKVLNQEGQHDKAYEYYAAFLACKKRTGHDISDTLKWLQNTPFLAKLRKRKDFKKLLSQK